MTGLIPPGGAAGKGVADAGSGLDIATASFRVPGEGVRHLGRKKPLPDLGNGLLTWDFFGRGGRI
jgi:hypothetical protein